MSDMTTEEILAKATPRPWKGYESIECQPWPAGVIQAIGTESGAGATTSLICDMRAQGNGKYEPIVTCANAELICMAVNSYEKQRECISGLITKARQVVNTFWETYEYRDKYTDNDCTKALEHLEAALARAEELLK